MYSLVEAQAGWVSDTAVAHDGSGQRHGSGVAWSRLGRAVWGRSIASMPAEIE
ncbi:MAG TPA: hypothetical protein VFZ97_10510 [Acidimicrobiales bacterium]